VWVRFSHHARNRLRLYGGTRGEVETVTRNPLGKSFDRDGNPMYLGLIGGTARFVVVASDDPDYVITVFPKERG
jgi:hypothetical protein